MPILSRVSSAKDRTSSPEGFSSDRSPAEPWLNKSRPKRPGLFETCANPGCDSGWLHLWRSRSAPIFEGGWNCSATCTAARVAMAVGREMDGRGSLQQSHRHRIPLGLVMLEQGWITSGQLRQALDAQKAAGAGRLGHWLVRQQGVSEQLVTRALALQSSCPVLSLELRDTEALTALVPRLFVDAFGALPLRVAAGKLLYLGFEDRLDPVLAFAIERMTGLRVESGLVQESLFRPAHTRMLSAHFPAVELIEATSEPALVHALTKLIEKAQPVESQLVRVHDCLWLRMWLRAQSGPVPETASIQDLICSIRAR
ncbi:MAG: hypothetical protein P4K86_01985 [Terracidiphilus sp.]|nr:hypothetical protein [Terracidiphilus sp.]